MRKRAAACQKQRARLHVRLPEQDVVFVHAQSDVSGVAQSRVLFYFLLMTHQKLSGACLCNTSSGLQGKLEPHKQHWLQADLPLQAVSALSCRIYLGEAQPTRPLTTLLSFLNESQGWLKQKREEKPSPRGSRALATAQQLAMQHWL